MDVAVWLRHLGLEQYEPAFRENKIEPDLLSSLTVEDLKDLGVTLVGDLRRLLDAIAALRAGTAPAGEPSPKHPAFLHSTSLPVAPDYVCTHRNDDERRARGG